MRDKRGRTIEINGHVVFDNGVLNGGLLAFHLYDTYGFPFDLTQQILRERGIEISENDFEKCLAEQQERSKKDRQKMNGNIAKSDEIWKELTEKLMKQHFETERLYYSGITECDASIIAIVKNNEIVDSLEDGEDGFLIFDKTTFYPCGGGEVGDSGVISLSLPHSSSYVFSVVKDTIKFKGDLIGHLVFAKETLRVGDKIRCVSFRKNIGSNHTATHLLQSALRIVLGDTVQQKGSQVSESSLRFDFSSNRAMTDDEKSRVEDIVNDWIDDCLSVSSIEMSKSEADKLGALAFFEDKYGEKVRVVRIFGHDGKAISTEFCCGIHARNTHEIDGFVIESEKSIGSGTRRIIAYTGDIAKQYIETVRPANDEILRLKDSLKEKDKAWENDCDKLLQTVCVDTISNGNIAFVCGEFSSAFVTFIRKKLSGRYDVIFTCSRNCNNGIFSCECVFSGKQTSDFDCNEMMKRLVDRIPEYTSVVIGEQNKKNYARAYFEYSKKLGECVDFKKLIEELLNVF